MERFDVRVVHAALYRPPRGHFVEVDVPPQRYLAVEGSGDPNTAESYRRSVEALYTVAYMVKFALKRLGSDTAVGPLEGLWRANDPAAFVIRDKAAWSWTMLLPQSPTVTVEEVAHGQETARARKPELAEVLDRLELRTLHEGRCLQALHVGPYDAEGPLLERLHQVVMPEQGLTFNGDHHEIYLGDPRRAAPEKLRTILRQPVRPDR